MYITFSIIITIVITIIIIIIITDRDSIPGSGWEFFSSSPLCPDRL
jgi:hypothetical protein